MGNFSSPARRARKRGLLASLLAIVMLALTTFGTAAVTAAPASASVGCYGDYCSGKDPQATGCANDAYTVSSLDVTGARLELRWSPTCKTNWARYIQYPRGWFMGNVPLQMQAVQDTGYMQRKSYDVNGAPDNSTTWTPMIYSPIHRVQARMAYQCTGVGDCFVGVVLTGEGYVKTGWV